MSEVSIETAAPAEIESLWDLERRCQTHPWNLHHFAAALRDGATRVRVLRAASADASQALLAFSVAQRAADEMHIHNLAVDPAHRRRGLGSRLLRDALSWGASLGATRGYLEVRQSNWPALALYRGAGFEAISIRRDYYERPREDAVVLGIVLAAP